MNYSDYDSDGYSSNEDADYVPSDDNLSEDDLNECVKEDPLDENSGVVHAGDAIKKKKLKGKDIRMRKRKKGGLKLEGEEKKAGDETEEKRAELQEEEDEERVGRKSADFEERQKKKADDLWASFLKDVGTKPKASSPDVQSTTSQKPDSAVSQAFQAIKEPPEPPEPSAKPTEPAEANPADSKAKPAEPSTVTITKVFDFAGEEVRVSKEVSADSREAKTFLKKQEKTDDPSPHPGPSTKRQGGMAGILGRIGAKKTKMSTLEKSRMDWDDFKSEEGITEELAIHNRGRQGYVERKNFLERVDQRQFELEKAVRLSNMKPR